MKKHHYILEKIALPLLVSFLTPIATSIGSKITTGNWTLLFSKIPLSYKVVFFLLIIFWIIINIVQRKNKNVTSEGPLISFIKIPPWGWENIGNISYAGVKWVIIVPAQPLKTLSVHHNISPEDLEIKIPPRCPKCETELEQYKSFIGGFIWKCIACGFKIRSHNDFFKEAERAKKIAKRQLEIIINNSQNS
ncbi:MAG: hypothetical protein H5U05_08295 [Candidatus Aminicenantes bacterium]|nr:hypothetical protein [Candidatus Aminicenantes bacterium]